MFIVGHEEKREFLRRLSEKALIPQSYLFTGPERVGKKRVALEFAHRLIGTTIPDDLDHPDLLLLAPEQEENARGSVKKKKLSVEQVRSATLFLSRYPALGKYRVLIIDDAEELSTEASNALLKILEEPQTTSILILITHRPGALLPTVKSRLVTVSFDVVPASLLHSSFETEESVLPDFFFSLGMPGLIQTALHDRDAFRKHQEFLRLLFRISNLSLRERLALSETLAEEEELPALLEEWLAGLHARTRSADVSLSQKRKFLLLLGRLQGEIALIIQRRGNIRLLLEKLLLSL